MNGHRGSSPRGPSFRIRDDGHGAEVSTDNVAAATAPSRHPRSEPAWKSNHLVHDKTTPRAGCSNRQHVANGLLSSSVLKTTSSAGPSDRGVTR